MTTDLTPTRRAFSIFLPLARILPCSCHDNG